jgi:hypothetical protein
MEESDNRPSLVLGLFATLPTGEKNPSNIVDEFEYDLPTGGGYFALDAYAAVRKLFYPYAIQFLISYDYYFPGNKIFFPGEPEIEFKNGNTFLASARFEMHLNDWIVLINEIGYTYSAGNTYYYAPAETTPSSTGILYVPSLYFQIRRFRFRQWVFVPVAGKYRSADPSYSIGLSYVF